MLFALDPGFGNSEYQKTLLAKYKSSSAGRLMVTDPISDQRTLFRELGSNPSAHLLYCYCHGYAPAGPGTWRRDGVKLFRQRIEALPEDSPQRAAFETLLTLTAEASDEAWMFIGSSEVLESKIKQQKFFLTRRPIVFLNMCQSAELMPSMSSGLVRVFLDHNASAVVGTEAPMSAVFANAFAEVVFDQLFAGDNIGTALRKARRHFLSDNQRNPLGLAYTLYGRALARLGSGAIINAKNVSQAATQ